MIAFTGATGFIGSYLVPSFHRKRIGKVRVLARNPSAALKTIAPDIEVVPGDLLSSEDCASFVKDVDVLFHLAHSNSPVNSDRDFPNDARANIIPLLNLIQALQNFGSKPHVIYFSSGGAVYGRRAERVPCKESEECSPSSSYGIQKLMAEHYLRLAAERDILTATVLRVGNVYGTLLPWQRMQGLIGVTLSNVVQGKPAVVFGDPENVRDYIHLEDLRSVCEKVVERRDPFSIFNIGTQVGHSVTDVLDVIGACTGLPFDRQYKGVGPADVWLPEWIVLDITKARTELGWEPRVDLATGIGRMLSTVTEYAKLRAGGSF